MTIDMRSTAWEAHNLDDMHYTINKTKDLLRDNGIQIIDAEIIKNQQYHDSSRVYLRDFRPIDTYSNNTYSAEYTVKLSQEMADNVLDLATNLDRSERERVEIKKQLSNLKEKYLAMKFKTTSLKTVLEQNPAIKEQWDEMMTMLKMAGFNDDLFED